MNASCFQYRNSKSYTKNIWSFLGLIGPYQLIHSHLLFLPGSQTHCHSFHVRFVVKSEYSLRHRSLLFLQIGNDLHFCHISTGLHKLVTHSLFGQTKSVCKVRLRIANYHERDSEFSTLLPVITCC